MSGNWGCCLLLLICIVVPHINSGKWITCHNLIILLLVRGNNGLHYCGRATVQPRCWRCKEKGVRKVGAIMENNNWVGEYVEVGQHGKQGDKKEKVFRRAFLLNKSLRMDLRFR